ncbi:LysR family transcriptional regulator [Burkholderia pseudomultivorans]|uniref:Hydrogen peroxide-inducible genes activator n=1 Tax=Burkholderia pseudomultivorans TaxID=1207504 RepID=A0A6P2Q791_9BURK|nr:LysR family transcriptional regulator [Burkholderia pseudomultivorans]MDR8727143.1 putative hydrogen peroxide-inducible genes activator [Burkholderia pseudomultivorans]MDR8733018.1 putative hydrogen peroxide-inducible genes activator [Burkholderia pseudomultivorans]MDR8739884.1 putative hydrogen peroxide-inducible genes activator [Burkholderia pseudomultivorans]MDR8756034.1 putative hydrogen peroxide-inducible genes activator [Burkholderia pseudomultivorans]MDR8775990.1 putative hydrogen pe
MNIRFLETFVWLAKLENFRLTAEKLHTTQAAVSSRIASLEEAFDVRLFDRNTRSATLTPAGRRMLAYAERIVRLDGEMRRDIDAASDAGLIRIGVIESIVHSWFPALMAQLRERYPRLDVEITSDTTLNLIRLLGTDSVDLILQTDAVPGPDVTNLPLCEFPVRWVASPRLGLGGERLDVARLAEFPIVSFSRHSGPHATIERLFAAVERPASINCITSVAAMIRLVADGFGVAALPPAIIGRELRDGALELLDVAPEFPTLPLVASYRTQGQPVAARIAELASEIARAMPTTADHATAAARSTRATADASAERAPKAKAGAKAKRTTPPAAPAGRRTRRS